MSYLSLIFHHNVENILTTIKYCSLKIKMFVDTGYRCNEDVVVSTQQLLELSRNRIKIVFYDRFHLHRCLRLRWYAEINIYRRYRSRSFFTTRHVRSVRSGKVEISSISVFSKIPWLFEVDRLLSLTPVQYGLESSIIKLVRAEILPQIIKTWASSNWIEKFYRKKRVRIREESFYRNHLLEL